MIQARKNDQEMTRVELNAFGEFFRQHPEFDTEENGKRMADYLLDTWKVEINAESLAVAKDQLVKANLLTPLSAAAVKLKTVIANYPKEPLDAFTKWFDSQTALINLGDAGFENAANLLHELRGREISPQKIQEAIGRLQYRGKLSFNEAPKSNTPPPTRMGLPNHAHGVTTHKPGVLFSKNEIDDRPHYERFGHKAYKAGTESAPVVSQDAWSRLLAEYRRAGNSHAQREQVAAIFNSSLQPREKVTRIQRILNPHLFQKPVGGKLNGQ
jgi:hypothetical protein